MEMCVYMRMCLCKMRMCVRAYYVYVKCVCMYVCMCVAYVCVSLYSHDLHIFFTSIHSGTFNISLNFLFKLLFFFAKPFYILPHPKKLCPFPSPSALNTF